MRIRLNQPDRDRDGSIDHPSMYPSRQHRHRDEDGHAQETADFPADVGNDIGQFSREHGQTYPLFPDATDEAGGEEVRNAAQHGGDGPRVDDLGIDDLQDVPHQPDLAAIDEYVEDISDRPVFDRSIENIEIGEETDIETGREDRQPGRSARLPEKEEQLADEESGVYDESMDGPGTRDLH
jgi:hypothetical protein